MTLLLARAAAGDALAAERLLPIVYQELRKLARWQMSKERPGQTLQPTALVHEAYLRLLGSGPDRFENRRHFFAAAAEAMRRILIERARRRRRLRHGGALRRVTLDEALALAGDVGADELLALDQALLGLERQDTELAEVVKLRHFAGMTIEEVAEATGKSVRTTNRQWSTARAWLKRELLRQGPAN